MDWKAYVDYDKVGSPSYRGIYVMNEGGIDVARFDSGSFEDDYRQFHEWAQAMEEELEAVNILQTESFSTWQEDRFDLEQPQ